MIPKVDKGLPLMILNVCMKFHADILNGFHVKHRHDFVIELLLTKFKGELLKNYIFKSYGCWALHVVLWCLTINTCIKL